MLWHLLLTFACGFAYEAICVFWLYHTEAWNSRRAALDAMAVALVMAVGVEQFLKGWPYVIAFTLGYGAGTYSAIEYHARRRYRGTR